MKRTPLDSMVVSRRRFLFQLGSLGVGAGLTHCNEANPLASVEKRGFALGSEVVLKAFHEKEAIASHAIEAAFRELALVEQLMSLYRPDSEISQLNQEGQLLNPHPYVVQILNEARKMAEASKGAFDVTIQPLWQCWNEGKGTLREGILADARALVDWRGIEIESDIIRLSKPGMKITLNGIAQGFAADRVARTFRRFGVTQAIIDTGELSAMGADGGSRPWKVGIQHPRNPNAYVALANLRDRCLATSGDYATRFSEDYRKNHLLDPRTGHSPEFFASVSVVAPTALEADALSTAFFVLSADEGLALTATRPGVDVLLIEKSGAILHSPGFPIAFA